MSGFYVRDRNLISSASTKKTRQLKPQTRIIQPATKAMGRLADFPIGLTTDQFDCFAAPQSPELLRRLRDKNRRVRDFERPVHPALLSRIPSVRIIAGQRGRHREGCAIAGQAAAPVRHSEAGHPRSGHRRDVEILLSGVARREPRRTRLDWPLIDERWDRRPLCHNPP